MEPKTQISKSNNKITSRLIDIDSHPHQTETTHHQAQTIHFKHYQNIPHNYIQIQTYWIPHPQAIVLLLHILLIEQQ